MLRVIHAGVAGSRVTCSPVASVRLVHAAPATGTDRVKEFSEIPGPKSWPIVGNMVQMLRHPGFSTTDIMGYWKHLFNEYGPIVKLKLPGMPSIVSSLNPGDVETFLQTTMSNPIREAFMSLKYVRDNAPNNYFDKKAGLLPENGEEWWRLRSRVQGPLLKPRNVATYLPQVDNATLYFMDRINDLQKEHRDGRVPDDFLQHLYKWALECVGLVALNKELGCMDPNLSEDSPPVMMIKHINDLFAALNETEMGLPTWRLYRSKAYVKLETAHNAFLEVADKCIQEAATKLEDVSAAADPNRRLTIMETLLNTEGLSKADVATMILDMLFAGVDTTSHTVAFTLYLLAKNPECQKKLQEEVDTILAGSKELLPEHIARMPYLNYVLKESLRLFPLTIGNARILISDVVMTGYKVPAGVLAIGISSLICRNETQFQRPEEFLPERWGRERPLGPIHPYASLPFSFGKRMCIGKRIAEQEIYAFLIRAMQRYSVTFESPVKMTVITQLVLKPNIPLAFKFHARN